nr:IS110 family transposase [Streptomyces alboniger]
MSTAYRGQGETEEKDAFVIADQARMRQDLGLLRPGDEIAVDLRTLTARHLDFVNDRTRQTNRLRSQLLEFLLVLECGLNLSKKGPVVLLTGYQLPAAIRRSGARRIGTQLEEPQGEQRPRARRRQLSRRPRPSTPPCRCRERLSRPPWSPASPRACWPSTRNSLKLTRLSGPGSTSTDT